MAARKEFTDEQKRLAVVMYRCGETIDAIAKKFGCSRQTLTNQGVLDEIPPEERRARMGYRATGAERKSTGKLEYLPHPKQIKAACERIRAGWPRKRLRRYEQQRARIPMLRESEVFTGNKAANY